MCVCEALGLDAEELYEARKKTVVGLKGWVRFTHA